MKTRTTVKVLNKSQEVVAEVRNLYPLNNQGSTLRYSDELSDYGYCRFRVSTKDPLLTELGDILAPLEYCVNVYRGDEVVWRGIIVDNPERNRNFIEVKAAQYEFFLKKVLIDRDPDKPDTELDETNFKVFRSGTMSAAITQIINKAVERFGVNHPLGTMTIGTIENPDYPQGATNENGAALTGPWTFTDFFNASFDYHSAYYVIKSFGIYAASDFEITADLKFNFKKFLGDKDTGITFRYGPQGNVVDYNFPRLGERVVNNLWGICADDEGKIYHYLAADNTLSDRYGLLEDAMALSDVKSTALLQTRAKEQLRLVKDPSSNPISVVLNEKSRELGNFGVGDIVNVEIEDHNIDFSEPRRIIGITTTVHDTGRELITIQTNKPRDEDLGA